MVGALDFEGAKQIGAYLAGATLSPAGGLGSGGGGGGAITRAESAPGQRQQGQEQGQRRWCRSSEEAEVARPPHLVKPQLPATSKALLTAVSE